MRKQPNTQLRIEKLIAISLLFASAIVSANGILHLARVTEQRRLSVAAHNYSTVRSMFIRQTTVGAGRMSGLIATNASFGERTPNR